MFNARNLIVARGFFNNFSTPDGPAVHTYYSDSDPIATVLSSGYFPAYFGFDSEFVKPSDTLIINTSSNQSYVCSIVNVTPFVTVASMQVFQRFSAVPTTGAYVGTFDVMFTKNLLTKIVSFEFLKLQQINTGGGNIQIFSNTGIPDPFKPDPSVGQIVKTMTCFNVSGNAAYNGYCFIQSSGIVFGPYSSATPGGGLFGGGSVQLTNFTVNYLGT